MRQANYKIAKKVKLHVENDSSAQLGLKFPGFRYKWWNIQGAVDRVIRPLKLEISIRTKEIYENDRITLD